MGQAYPCWFLETEFKQYAEFAEAAFVFHWVKNITDFAALHDLEKAQRWVAGVS